MGNAEYLAELCKKHGIGFTSLGHICADGISVSASVIREMIQHGDVQSASILLGRYHYISGKVISGNRIGRTLGFPTANIEISQERVVPKNGVYLTKAYTEASEHFGITNVGRHPTVLVDKTLAETFLFNFDHDIYSKKIKLEFLEFIRKEKTFDSLEALTLQVETDIDKVTRLIEKKYS